MSNITFDTSSWLQNAGLVGIVNILDIADRKLNYENNQLSFDTSVLDTFHEDYFYFFENKYLEFFSYSSIVNKANVFLETSTWTEETIKNWNKYIETVKKLLTSNSYKSAYEMIPIETSGIINLEKSLKKIKLKKNQQPDEVNDEVIEMKQYLKAIIKILHNERVKKYIVAKNASYSVIDKFWGNVSFLHKTKTKNDIFEEYKQYFIDPIFQYLEENHEKDKYICFTCSNPIKKLSKPAAFDMAWLNKMGVDMGRKTSHFWNLNSSTSYICPICNFLYSCIPAGFTVIKGLGYFVNSNQSIEKMVKLNNPSVEMAIKEDESIPLAELKTYYMLLDYMESRKLDNTKHEMDNIQIIKFSSVTDADRQRPFTFNVLSKDKLQVIKRHRKRLSELVTRIVKVSDEQYLNVFEAVLERLYKNKNQFDLIDLLFRSSLSARGEEPLRGGNIIMHILRINNSFLGTLEKKGDDEVAINSSYVKKSVVESMKTYGKKLAIAYSTRGAANKLSGITYRLLNALKTRDSGKFMDAFINAHLYCGQSIPNEITDALQDEHKLQTMGYAFLVGLRSGNLNNGNEREEKQ